MKTTKPKKRTPKKSPKPAVKRTRSLRDNRDLMRQGFALYCDGMTVEGVYGALRAEWPSLSLRTLERIAADNKWLEQRTAQAENAKEQDAVQEDLLQGVIASLTTMKGTLDARLAQLNFQEQAQYLKICQELLTLKGQYPTRQSATAITEEDVSKLFQVIERHRVLGPLWKKHKVDILNAFKKARS